MASGTKRTYAADTSFQINDVFALSADDRDVTITNFDSLSKTGTASHDLLDLTAIFDGLGGKFTDGVNDTADRSAALQFATGDFDGDGKADDLRVSISGMKDFAVTLINPADSSSTSYGVYAQNVGSASDIVVGGTASALAPSAGTSTVTTTPTVTESANNAATTGSAPLYDGAKHSFAINAAQQVTVDGVANTYTGNVAELVYHDGAIYQHAVTSTSSGWFKYTPGSGWHDWVQADGDPRPATTPTTPSESANGATTTAGGTALYDDTHDTFAINANHQVVIGGVVDSYTADVQDLLYKDGSIYQHAVTSTSSGWFQYTPGSGWHDWTKVADPTGGTTSDTPTTPATPTTPSTPTIPSTPTTPTGNLTGQYTHLDNGVNVTANELYKMTLKDWQYLKSVGVEHVRLAVDPYQSSGSLDPAHNWAEQLAFKAADQAIQAGLSVVLGPVSPHDIGSYQNNGALQNQMISWFKETATYISQHYTPDKVFIEMPNEPFWGDPKNWWTFQGKLIDAVHSVAPNFTVVATANGYNGNNDWEFTNSLTSMTPYADKNVVYNVHFYDDMRFTSQGASWVDYTKNITDFHYGQDGYDAAHLDAILGKMAAWADKYDVQVTVNEFGVIKYANQTEAARWYNDVHDSMAKYGFGWSAFEYDKSGGLYNIAHNNGSDLWVVNDAIMKALDWGPYHTDALLG